MVMQHLMCRDCQIRSVHRGLWTACMNVNDTDLLTLSYSCRKMSQYDILRHKYSHWLYLWHTFAVWRTLWHPLHDDESSLNIEYFVNYFRGAVKKSTSNSKNSVEVVNTFQRIAKDLYCRLGIPSDNVFHTYCERQKYCCYCWITGI